MIYLSRAFLVLCFSIFLASLAVAETAIFPAALADREGLNLDSSGNPVPVGPWRDSVSKAHGIYDADGFGASSPILIKSFNLRPDEGSPIGSVIGFDNLKLSFAVTPREPQHLSGMFADNLNTVLDDPVIVYDQAWESTAVGPLLSNGTRPFDFKVALTNFFEYDPSQGNLLVEWVIGLPTQPARFDFENDFGGFADQATNLFSGVDPVGGGGVGGFGVVTQFEFEAVPEPGSAFPAVACIFVAVSRLRKQRTNLSRDQ